MKQELSYARLIKKYAANLVDIVFYFFYAIVAIILLLILIFPLIPLRILFYLINKKRKNRLQNIDFSEIVRQHSQKRISDMRPILSILIPKDARSALDIGSDRTQEYPYLKKFFDKYITLDLYRADITQDLNINKRIKMEDNSIDIVIISNILEHLVDPLPIAIEANRIAKKYVLLGLPNEYTIDKRLYFLLGLSEDKIYPFGHKHRFSLKLAEDFVNCLWGEYSLKEYKFSLIGENFIPEFIKKILLRLSPSFFAGEVFYLIEKRNVDLKKALSEKNLLTIYPQFFVKEIFHLKKRR